MILIHIITNDYDQAAEVADYLANEKLILNAVMLEVSGRKRITGKKYKPIDQILVMGKTKALLFNTIDKMLRELYPENMPVLYSIPIVNMDWEQANELVKETVKV
ncbi:hypothetical protein [Flexithrix dorotheae]|uniref:hypothetical protein n=1 Tax=Flexithrix dorotheae TaxID=70993 RepID=UPI00037CAD2D|nr:hypothetical protein [Flexithrix dorotheae]